MNNKAKFLIDALRAIVSEKNEGIDLNKEKPERELKIALLEKSFNDLLSVLEEGQEDKKNINEMIDGIIEQLRNFEIKDTGTLDDILPRIYKKTDFVELPVTKEIKTED